MNFINNAEMAGLVSEGFAKQIITSSTSNGTTTTTIYGGKAPVPSTDPSTDDLETWRIMRTVVVDDGTSTNFTSAWATGSWTNRENLTYKYL